MRTNALLNSALAAILLIGASACGLKGDLYLTETAKPNESPATEPKTNGGPNEDPGMIGPPAAELSDAGEAEADGSGESDSAETLAEDEASAGLSEADEESATGKKDESPEAAAPAP